MANPLLIAAGIGTVAAAAGIGVYQHQSQADFAQVLEVQPITETYFVSREECRDEVVQETVPSRDNQQVTGTVVGAVLGAIIGNQVGGGNGKKLATVAGAAAGGYAGKRVQEDMQRQNVQSRTERHCQTLEDPKQRITGYQVRYGLNDETGTVVMNEPPGEQIPVVNGKLQLDVEQP